MNTCYRSCFIVGIVIITLAKNIIAIPNYWDPKNIITAQDPFWSFGLTKHGIEQLSKVPTARKELWEKIATHAREFKKHATQRIEEQALANPDEANAYKQASDMIEHAQEEARAILFPIGLSSTERASIDAIINKTAPEKVLKLDKQAKKLLQQLKTPRMGGSRFQEQVPLRIALEKNYEQLTSFLKEITKRPNLSRKDRALISRAQEALEHAYNELHKYVSFS